MGDIPVSSVVRVTIGTSPTFPTRKGFGTLNIIGPSSVIGALERCRVFNTIDGVAAAGFPLDSEEYKAAQVYWSQNPGPRQLIISRRVAAPIGAELRGGANPQISIPAWKAIIAGSLKTNIGDVAVDIIGLDFAAANTLPAVAAILQTAIRAADLAVEYTAATVQYKDGRFFLTAGTTGASSRIDLATDAATGTPVANLLQWDAAGNARTSDGYETETIVQAAAAAQAVNQDWYGWTVTKEMRDDDQILDAAAWTQARIKVFGFDTEDRENLDPTNEVSLAYQLDQGKYDRTIGLFNDTAGQYAATSALSRAFIVNFNAPDSTITLKFKQLPTITPADLDANQKAGLDSVHLNAYYDVGGNIMMGEGTVFGGRFFDEVHGIDWLQNAIETNVFGKLYTDQTKTAYTDPGVASLQQMVEKALDQGVSNGLLAPGYLQDGTYLSKGYVTSAVKVKDVDQSSKEARQGPPISFTCIGAGAIHGIDIIGNFQR